MLKVLTNFRILDPEVPSEARIWAKAEGTKPDTLCWAMAQIYGSVLTSFVFHDDYFLSQISKLTSSTLISKFVN